jgi:hypothetical protein
LAYVTMQTMRSSSAWLRRDRFEEKSIVKSR